jgi:hypothetical protein
MRWQRHDDPTVVLTWKGDAVGYRGAHYRIRNERGPASEYDCLHCGGSGKQWALIRDIPLENLRSEIIDGRQTIFSPNPMAYIPLCVSCHLRYDRQSRRLRHEGAAS